MPDKDYQSKRDEVDHYNCAAIRIASMPGGGTTIKDVHDAIEKLVSSERQKAARERESKLLDELETWNAGANGYTTDWIASKRQQLGADSREAA